LSGNNNQNGEDICVFSLQPMTLAGVVISRSRQANQCMVSRGDGTLGISVSTLLKKANELKQAL
jgi:hypothetical protein